MSLDRQWNKHFQAGQRRTCRSAIILSRTALSRASSRTYEKEGSGGGKTGAREGPARGRMG